MSVLVAKVENACLVQSVVSEFRIFYRMNVRTIRKFILRWVSFKDQRTFFTRCCTKVTLLYKMYVVLPRCNDVSRPWGPTYVLYNIWYRTNVLTVYIANSQSTLRGEYVKRINLGKPYLQGISKVVFCTCLHLLGREYMKRMEKPQKPSSRQVEQKALIIWVINYEHNGVGMINPYLFV